jgi:hypothetical protein
MPGNDFDGRPSTIANRKLQAASPNCKYGTSDDQPPSHQSNVSVGYDEYRKRERCCKDHSRHGRGVHAVDSGKGF